ncbi:MAG: tRNA (adenosine(37)-N6)-dimethylallyltransferase MiaA [Patescibacteria group bacterium]
MPNNKLIVILGPTATGKTKLAVKMARAFNGEIVSADSRQVYQGMDIGTGKDLQEYKTKKPISYHLIDVISPKKQFTLANYQKLAYKAIDDVLRKGKLPFLVGGTGLYIQAIVDGYNLPQSKPNIKLRKKLNKKSLAQLQTLAKKYKITLNQSDWQNKVRLVRKIEISINLKVKSQKLKVNAPKYDCLILGLTLPKEKLIKRIKLRLKKELTDGLVKEVKKLRQNGLLWKKLESFGLEYRFVAQYLQNKLTYDEMFNKLLIALSQFAKRQMTWFKKDKKIIWLKNKNQAKKLIRAHSSTG